MDEMNAAELPQDLPAPIETNADVSDPSAHAFAQRQEEQARARTDGKPRSIRDSLTNAEKTVQERARNETLQKVLEKDLKDLKPTERKQLKAFLQERPADLSDEEKQARKGVLAELKKLEPKRDKPEGVGEAIDNRRNAIERAFKAHAGNLDRADLATTEQRQLRADLKARWPEKNLSDVLRYFETWHEKIAANPHTAWQELAQEYATYTSPQNDRRGKSDSDGKSIGDSLLRANGDMSDIADMAEFIKKYGAQTPELIRRANEWDKALRADPFGAAARLAANMGGINLPAAEQQSPAANAHQQHDPRLVPPKSYEERVANIHQGLERFVQQEAPDFDEYANEVLKILQSGAIPAHIDNHTTVRLAYQAAKKNAAERKPRAEICLGRRWPVVG